MRTRLATGMLAVAGLLAAAGLLTAGCSSGPNAGAGHPGTPVAAGGGNAGPDSKSLYLNCLETHGAPVTSLERAGHTDSAVNRNSPRLRRAMQACRSLQPSPGSAQTITAQDQTDYLRAVQCMRTHGVPQFPDPVFANGGVHFPAPPAGLDIHSRQVLGAEAICRRLIPRGLPYSS